MYLVIDSKRKKGYLITDNSGLAELLGVTPEESRKWFRKTVYKKYKESYHIIKGVIRIKSKRHASKKIVDKYFKKNN